MHLAEPRVPPVTDEGMTADQKDLLQPIRERNGRVDNVFRTVAQNPKLAKKWMVFAGYILRGSTLGARDREILILRIGWLCQAEYEWAQHVVIGRQEGLSAEEIEAIKTGADAPGWSDRDKALLRATDELHENAFVSDATWKALAGHYNQEQLMDLVFTVGQYNLVSMALNSFGVQLDEGLRGF